MEVTITKFRQELFELVNRAMDGEPVTFTHKGYRFRIVPEDHAPDRFRRVTSRSLVNPKVSEASEAELKREMTDAWEGDWSDL